MNSFNTKGPLVKGARWFSWWENYCFHMPEFFGCRLVLEQSLKLDVNNDAFVYEMLLDDAADVDPQKELAKLKSLNGGFALAVKIMTMTLYKHCKILFNVSEPCWHTHSHRAETVKNADQGLQRYIDQSDGKFIDDEHRGIIRASLTDTTKLYKLLVEPACQEQSSMEHQDLTELTAEFGLTLLSYRSWTNAQYMDYPPFRYAGALSDNLVVSDAKLDLMQTDWVNMMELEQAALTDPYANRIRGAMHSFDSKPFRIMYQLFERH